MDKKRGLFLFLDVEGDEVVFVGALVVEVVLALEPRDLPSHGDGHQVGEKVMVAVAADPARLMRVDLESVADLVTSAARPLDGLHLRDVNGLLPCQRVLPHKERWKMG